MSLLDAIGGAFDDVREGVRLAPLWSRLAIDQTVARYRRTLLGPFWLASSTLAIGIGMSLVFGTMFGADWRTNFPFIMTGVLCFNMISTLVSDAATTFIYASGTMQTRKLPLSFHTFLNNDRLLINFSHQLVGYWIINLVVGLAAVPHWEFLPNLALVLAIGFVLSFPLGMISTRYRDVNYFIAFAMQMSFMLTPVFWRPASISGKFRWIAQYNPLAHMLEILRQPLLGHPAPMSDLIDCLGILAAGTVLAVISLAVYRRRVVFWL